MIREGASDARWYTCTSVCRRRWYTCTSVCRRLCEIGHKKPLSFKSANCHVIQISRVQFVLVQEAMVPGVEEKALDCFQSELPGTPTSSGCTGCIRTAHFVLTPAAAEPRSPNACTKCSPSGTNLFVLCFMGGRGLPDAVPCLRPKAPPTAQDPLRLTLFFLGLCNSTLSLTR